MVDSTGKGNTKRSFTETLWDLDEKALIQGYIVRSGKEDSDTALAILQAKATLAAEAAVEQTRRMAHQTLVLAWATVVMAASTILLAVVTIVKN